MNDHRRRPHSAAHRAAISAGMKRAYHSRLQRDLASRGLPHDFIPLIEYGEPNYDPDIANRHGGRCRWCGAIAARH